MSSFLSPQPLQIIATGDSDTDCFQLNNDNLSAILSKIPPDVKVSILSVVGAFRTGKSFLLNFFLRYLRYSDANDSITEMDSSAWMIAEGDELSEGNCNEGGWNLVGDDGSEVKKDASFAWRGGQERQTTGIWMWSEPFIRRSHAFGDEKFAVLLMDTQGMFDNESTMTLTAQIFGLSTLVSSFQIYNVDKRIQEDNLQHLALFSEYGRMALMPPSAKETSTNEAPDPTPIASADAVSDGSSTIEPVPELKPFQRLQFLLRDWQNFDSDYEEGQSDLVYQSLRADMQKYLTDVLRTRGQYVSSMLH